MSSSLIVCAHFSLLLKLCILCLQGGGSKCFVNKMLHWIWFERSIFFLFIIGASTQHLDLYCGECGFHSMDIFNPFFGQKGIVSKDGYHHSPLCKHVLFHPSGSGVYPPPFLSDLFATCFDHQRCNTSIAMPDLGLTLKSLAASTYPWKSAAM